MADFLSALGQSRLGDDLINYRRQRKMDEINNMRLAQEQAEAPLRMEQLQNSLVQQRIAIETERRNQARLAEEEKRMNTEQPLEQLFPYLKTGHLPDRSAKMATTLLANHGYATPSMGSDGKTVYMTTERKLRELLDPKREQVLQGVADLIHTDTWSELQKLQEQYGKLQGTDKEKADKIQEQIGKYQQTLSILGPVISQHRQKQVEAQQPEGPKPPNTIAEMEYAASDPAHPFHKQAVAAVNAHYARTEKTAKAGATTVNINQKQETEEAKTVGEELGKYFIGLKKAGESSYDSKQAYIKFKELLRNANTGKLAPAYKTILQYSKAMGIDIGDKELPALEAMNAIGNQLAMKMRNPESGFGLTGQTSDRDVQFLKDAVPGIEKSPQGNMILLDWAIKLADRKIQIAKMAQAWRTQHGTINGFDAYLDEWKENNLLFQQTANKQRRPLKSFDK